MNIIKQIRKLWAKMVGGERLIGYLRDQGMKIGNNCRIFSDISTSESYLIEIGDNVSISGHVTLITHDASIQKVIPGVTDLFGRIKIGNNCFIGHGVTILYGVTIPDNTIVAAGSVVTQSVAEPGKIIGGNPAKVIGTREDFGEKYREYAVNIKNLTPEEKRSLLEQKAKMVVK